MNSGSRLDRDHRADRQEDPEHDDRDGGDPVALVPERNICQRHSPQYIRRHQGRLVISGGTLTAKTRL